ncbi:hypothetical protein JCM8097_009321 [Rhodosporidiobolus ruineniae]
MSTALVNHFDDLTLADPSSPRSADPTSSTFHLKCSDGETVSVDSALLSAISSVFRDMLDVGAGEKECDVTEPSEVIKLFLEAVKEGKVPIGEMEWSAIYDMMEKYDVPVLRAGLLCEGWHTYDTESFFAYAVGVKLENRQLTEKAAAASVRVYWEKAGSSCVFASLPSIAREKLVDFHDRLLARRREFLEDAGERSIESCDCDRRRAIRNSWNPILKMAVDESYSRLTPSKDPAELVRSGVVSRWGRTPNCEDCISRMHSLLDEFDRIWARRQNNPIQFKY